MVRRCLSLNCPPSGRAVGVRHPHAMGAGVWVWGPNTVPLACMPCGGCVPRGWWGAVPGVGWPATVVRGVWCQALSLPWPPLHSGAGSQGSATRVSRVRLVWAWGPSTGPTACAVAGRHCASGVAEGRPRGGVPFAVVRGVWGQALPLPWLPALWAGCPGPLPTCCGRGCAGVGTLPRPRGPRALWGAARHRGGGGRRVQAPPLPCCPPSGRAAGACWPRAVGEGVVVRVALRLSLWCPPHWCFVAVLRSPCACLAPFPARVTCSSAGYPLFLSWHRRSIPFPLPSFGSFSSLACRCSLPPPWCVSRSFPVPASLAPVLGPSSFSPVGSCETEGGLGRVGLLGN